MAPRLSVDRDVCMGSGNCIYWAPRLFDLDDAGFAVVVGDPASDLEAAQLAAENCPTRAITFDPD
ncbi:MAG: ferredoxin [Acidimicrobiales bacterium]|nr:ferredoxin [Acidimicrobiales bacterium]